MRKYEFRWMDVFTDEPFLGNQLAVFPDAAGLNDAQMQCLAKETGLSETTFVFRRDAGTEGKEGIRARIFTTEEELPFAGHPTLGTAAVMSQITGQNDISLHLKAGKIRVRFETSGDGPAFGEMRQLDPQFLGRLPTDEVANALGASSQDLETDLPVEMVSTGVPFAMVPFRSLPRLQDFRVDLGRVEKYLQDKPAKFFYLVCRQTVDPEARLHARMIFYSGEDPATGSAAGCCAAWMARNGVAGSGERIFIEQGLECGRKSRIFVSAEITSSSEVVNVRVGGHVVHAGSGIFNVR